MKKTALADSRGVDAGALTAEIASAVAAERAGQSHGAVGRLLRQAMADARVSAFKRHDRGDRIALDLSRSVDIMLRALYEHAPQVASKISVCAVGGYGRRELAPFSDIDLLILHEDEAGSAVDDLLNFFLYPLWDSGMKIGHGVHSPKGAVTLATNDIVARTAYLDIRFLCGSKSLYEELRTRYEKLRRRTETEFVAAKLKEQEERQREAGETRYLVEPDIKEGKGGLRDVQTIRWIYKYVFGGTIGENEVIDRVLDSSEVRSLRKAERFLWSVRAHLHDLRGRADEQLTFDIQPAVAERLGYADRRNMTAAERLMRHYFVTAVDIGRLTRVLCARLEEERAKRLPHFPRRLPKALQADEGPGKPNICIRNGRLDFDSAARARKNPRDLFRLFRAYSKHPKMDFHPDALAIVADQVPRVTSEIRKDPVVAELFRGILESREDPVRVLRVMTETGLLSKYVPAYGEIVGRIHYGLYRRYTLDEHVLRSIGVLARIRSGELEDDHPVSTRVVREAPSYYLIALALLLHESIWTVRDRSREECEKLIKRVTRRLGLNEEEAALAAWCASNYLLLVRTAERRNLTEVHTIASFAAQVATRERLDLMVVLSTCHLRVVGLHSWDEVIRRQLIELYEASVAWFDEGEAALQRRMEARAKLARDEAKTRLADWSKPERDAFLSKLTDDMLRCIDPEIIVRFAYLVRAAEEDAADAAVTVTLRDGDLECIVYADDRPGLLADVASAVAGEGLSVRSVQALTTSDGRALDIFAVQSPDGMPVDDPSLARRLHAAMLAASRKAPARPPNLKRRLGDRRVIFTVEPSVRIERDASRDATVVEAEGLDRPGLLYEVASALGEIGVSIDSAHVATYGERAVDAFYLTNARGEKITDARTLRRIERRLVEVLAAGAKG